MEGQDQLKELSKQIRKLNRENGRLQAELTLLKGLNEQVTSVQKYIQQENRRQVCYNNQLLKTFPYILIMVDDHLNTVMASDAFLHISGVNRDEIKEGLPLREAVSYILEKEKTEPFVEKCRYLLDHAQNDIAVSEENDPERNMITSVINGEEKILQYDISYYLEENDNVRGLSIVFTDMTEIVEAKEKAVNADKAKSSFLASMSHEIRTPINAVLGMNEMILREAEEETILEYANNIDSAGKTLLSLINSILDFSKIEDGKMEIIPVRYDTASFINDLYHSIIQRADAKGLSFVMDVDEMLPRTLIGDDVRFSQIIMNLLTNAVKYTEKGSVTLSLRMAAKRDRKAELEVAVKDTGIGIREEDTERLFESFERLDEVRNHNIEGTGLGISIVTNLLKMMGSHLTVESVYGEGSTFSFAIEQEIFEDTPIGDYEKWMKENRIHKNKEELISAPSAKVLVVDDNEMNLKVAGNLLKLCKISPDEAYSGEEAIDFMRKHNYDIVFLDHMMPKMDGIETLARLRAERLVPDDTVMIALTANAVVGAREKYLEAGFDDYLSKPMEIKQLVGKLTRYLPGRAYDTMEAVPGGMDKVLEFAPEEEILEFEPSDEIGKSVFDMESIRSHGIDTATGLNYCAGDEALYFEMLDDFAVSGEKKIEKLERFFADGDWQEYQIAVHALKSNSRMLGMNDAFEQTRALENAARNNDTEFIKEHHQSFIMLAKDKVEFLHSCQRDTE